MLSSTNGHHVDREGNDVVVMHNAWIRAWSLADS
jgi:hypothetical protein